MSPNTSIAQGEYTISSSQAFNENHDSLRASRKPCLTSPQHSFAVNSPKNDPIQAPVVLVEGFLGPSRQWYFGPAEEILNDRKCIFVYPGVGNSVHDRAIEIYYQLKGGRVDYGEEHSATFGHARYGREYQALYPEWSVEKPLHFLGHSLGGLTIWKLQQFLASNIFPAEHNPHPDMVLSLTSVSTPFRGSTLPYILGQRPDTTGCLSRFSWGYWIHPFFYIYECLDIRWLKDNVFDTHLDHWELTWRSLWKSDKSSNEKKGWSGIKLVKSLVEGYQRTQWFGNEDHAPYDMSMHGVRRLNEGSQTFSNTFYRNYVGSMTCKDPTTQYHKPKTNMSFIPMFPDAIGSFKYPKGTVDKPVPDEELSQWHENDGLVPVISQKHPEYCSVGYCIHHEGLPDTANDGESDLKSGIWDVWEIPDLTHFSIMPVWRKTERQDIFYSGYKQYLDRIEKRLSTCSRSC